MEPVGSGLSNQQCGAVLDTLALTDASADLALEALDLATDCSRQSNVSPTREQGELAAEALGAATDALDSMVGALKALNKSLNPGQTE